jgi:hypothetical protein
MTFSREIPCALAWLPLVEPVTSETLPFSGQRRHPLRFVLNIHGRPFRVGIKRLR